MTTWRPCTLPPDANPRIFARAAAWWTERTLALNHLPARSDLDPADLGASALPHAILVEIIDNAADLRFRLVGTAIVQFTKRDLTGKLFSEVYPPDTPVLGYVKGLYAEMIAARRPLWSVNEFVPPTVSYRMRMQRLMLPLSSTGDVVDLCLAIQKIDSSERPAGDQVLWRAAKDTGELERRLL